MDLNGFNDLFTQIENAVDAHQKLRRPTGIPVLRGATMQVNRLGFCAEIRVSLLGSRKRPSTIRAFGDTAAEATNKLIDGLDIWAEALK
jgi:hypothetical protein